MKLKEVTSEFYECGTGWHHIINEALDVIRDCADRVPEYQDLEVLQVKEKFGGLRIYLSYHDDYLDGVIHLAGNLCETTCENCGGRGQLGNRPNPYGQHHKTLCDKHEKEAYEKIHYPID